VVPRRFLVLALVLVLLLAQGFLSRPFSISAADPTGDLLKAAAAGQIDLVRSDLDAGANPEARDKRGRTPLMIAAQRGHSDIVTLLLARGANAQARDKDGWTAYALAMFDADLIHPGQNAVLKALPKPGPYRVSIEAAWTPQALISSCFMSRDALVQHVSDIFPEALMAASLRDTVRGSELELVQIDRMNRHGVAAAPAVSPAPDLDAVISLYAVPGASCAQPSDHINMSIEMRVYSRDGKTVLFRKTFGAGVRGLHVRSVNNPGQYAAVYGDIVKAHTEGIYHAILETLLKSSLS
jgi:hypothetical protein